MHKPERLIAGWLLCGCVLIFLMVIVGGITRLTGSGLSITEWNVVKGTLPPLNEAEWKLAFAKYKESPQFRSENITFNLLQFKHIFWWEFFHRLLGRVIGVVFIFPFLYFYFTRRLDSDVLRKLLVLLGLGALQGFLGWFMVKSGLINLPHVSHYRLAVHLITAFLIFGYSFRMALNLIYPLPAVLCRLNKRVRNLSTVLLLLAILQIIYGALVAGLHAGKIYNSFPKMGSRWVPSEINVLQPCWKNFTENLVTVQFIHRTLAWLIGILICIIWVIGVKKRGAFLKQTQSHHVLLALFFLQFLLGIATLLTSVSIPLAVLHQCCAFFLFAGILFHLHSSKVA